MIRAVVVYGDIVLGKGGCGWFLREESFAGEGDAVGFEDREGGLKVES